MSPDPLDLLEEALVQVRSKGHVATGWLLESDELGYVAWLYLTDDDTEIPLWSEAELKPTVLQACRACLQRALELPEMVAIPES